VRLKQSIVHGRHAPEKLLVFLFILGAQAVIFSPWLYAQNISAFPRTAPDPKALEYFRRQNYTWEDLSEISLWAGGNLTPENIGGIAAAATLLNNSGDFPLSGRERAEYILTFMHKNYLRSYSHYQTRVDTIFINGSYNCVSSAVLYMILCELAGIDTSAVITREHVFIMVHIDGQDIDVETTNKFGFDPGNRKEFHDQFGRLTGFSYVPARNYRSRQTIGKIELISLILNNRIADLERRNNYADAVPAAIDRAALLYGDSLAETADESDSLFHDPRKDLMDRLLNYGGALLNAGREEDSLRWAAAASSLYPSRDRWDALIHAAFNNRITRFLTDNNAAGARNFLENNRAYLKDIYYAGFNAIITDFDLSYRRTAHREAVIPNTETKRD